GADHDRHGVGVAAEAFEEAVELGVQHGVARDALLELFVFGGVRQFAVQQQVADFQEVGLRGQLVDRIAAVQQHASVAVDIGQGRFAGRRGGEAGVEGEGAGAAVQLADIDDVRAGRAGKDGELYSLVLIGQGRRAGGFRLFSHLGPLFFLGPARGGGRPELVMGDHLVCCSASSKRPRLSSRPSAQSVRAISGDAEPAVKAARMEGPIFPKPTPSSWAKTLSSASKAKASQLWKRPSRSRSREIRSPLSPCSKAADFSLNGSGRTCNTNAVWSASSGMVLARSLMKGMAR